MDMKNVPKPPSTTTAPREAQKGKKCDSKNKPIEVTKQTPPHRNLLQLFHDNFSLIPKAPPKQQKKVPQAFEASVDPSKSKKVVLPRRKNLKRLHLCVPPPELKQRQLNVISAKKLCTMSSISICTRLHFRYLTKFQHSPCLTSEANKTLSDVPSLVPSHIPSKIAQNTNPTDEIKQDENEQSVASWDQEDRMLRLFSCWGTPAATLILRSLLLSNYHRQTRRR